MNYLEMTKEQLLEYAIEHIQDLSTASHYIEPGYDNDSELVILFANWNNVDDDLQEALQAAGYEMEWSDEWTTNDKGGAVRTSPDSYSWTPSYAITDDGDILTIEDTAHEWIEAMKCYDHMHTPKVIPSKYNLAEEGMTLYNPESYETGLHPGQHDDPQKTLAEILENHPNAEVVFQISEQSQFYTKWDAWFWEV